MTTLRSFTNCHLTKQALIDRMEKHQKLDELKQNLTGQDGQGCTIWCALDRYDHSAFPKELGLPEWLAHLVDSIFERLPQQEAIKFSSNWIKAIPIGSDLTLVKHRFLHALLVDPSHGVINYSSNSATIETAAELHMTAIKGEIVSMDNWTAAAWAEAAWAEAAWQRDLLLDLLKKAQ